MAFGMIEQCPQCGSAMEQTGADMERAYYKCGSCGFKKIVSMNSTDNAEFEQKKSDLLSRIRLGFVDWRVTQWGSLQKDLLDFVGRYEAAKNDIQLQIGIVACITGGFQTMDSEKYKQCKVLFKITEKIYKQKLKELKKQSNSKLYESVSDYKELRSKYIKCRNDYRNTKLIWKIVLLVFRKIAA